MKIKLFNQNLSSTLSCILKCLGFLTMIQKRIILGLFLFIFFGACASPTAVLGPVFTLSSGGSIAQSGLSYGSSELIKSYTGKTPMENLIEIKDKKEKENIQKKALESEDFYFLVKNRIEKTNKVLKSSN